MTTAPSGTRKALVCRSVSEANRGGVLEDVELSALTEAFRTLRLLEPAGAAKVEDPGRPGEPYCPQRMPKSCRLLRVTHAGQVVGVVVPTFKGGAHAQRDGAVSEASGNPSDRSNLASFFRGGTAGRG